MARLELMLLGGFQACLVPGGAINLPTRTAKALLAYLALPAGKPHSRDELAALRWGDAPELQARGSLRKALFWLRQALSDAEAVMSDAETVELKAGAVSIDVGEFERLAGVGKSRLAAGLGVLAVQRGGRVLLGRCYETSPDSARPF